MKRNELQDQEECENVDELNHQAEFQNATHDVQRGKIQKKTYEEVSH